MAGPNAQAGPGGDGGGGTTGDSPWTENIPRQDGSGEYQPLKEGPGSVPGANAQDATLAKKGAKPRRGWFTTLPEAVREADKSRNKIRLPRGYEELLRRYFEDQD